MTKCVFDALWHGHSQIGKEKHRMFSVFMQVPKLVISRLAARSQKIHDARRLQRTQLIENYGNDVDDDEVSERSYHDCNCDWQSNRHSAHCISCYQLVDDMFKIGLADSVL